MTLLAPAAKTHYNRGASYNNRGRRGDRDRAVADFRRALELDPYYQASRDALRRLGVTPPPLPQLRFTPN
jgi:hypothetical protein